MGVAVPPSLCLVPPRCQSSMGSYPGAHGQLRGQSGQKD